MKFDKTEQYAVTNIIYNNLSKCKCYLYDAWRSIKLFRFVLYSKNRVDNGHAHYKHMQMEIPDQKKKKIIESKK